MPHPPTLRESGDRSELAETTEAEAPSGAAAISMVRLSRAFGLRRAVRSLTLAIAEGERLAIMGPNGAGKSTLIRMLATLLRPTSGNLFICGFDAAHDGQEVRRRIGVLLHETLLYPDLTVEENLRFFARLYSIDGVAKRLTELYERLALQGLERTRVRRLSRGQQQRAALARALLHGPEVLLLDEPDTGLDLRTFELLSGELRRDRSTTIIFTTHQPGHALDLATRLLVMRDGIGHDLGPATEWSAESLQRAVVTATPEGIQGGHTGLPRRVHR
ncbi:MAG: ABC transporter ATP-binding protein [Dehalococcoidia bacterium]